MQNCFVLIPNKLQDIGCLQKTFRNAYMRNAYHLMFRVSLQWKVSPQRRYLWQDGRLQHNRMRLLCVFQRGRPTQISLNPMYLVPWLPCKDNKVLIIGHHQFGQAGKLVKLEDGCCLVEVEASGANTFDKLDVVNLLQK